MRNDPALAARHGRAAMQQGAYAVGANDPTFRLTILEPVIGEAQALEITIAVTGASLRLDRVLARALRLGRREIEALGDAMTIPPAARKALRRQAIDGQRVTIDLADCAEATAARLRRLLADQAPDLYCATLSPR